MHQQHGTPIAATLRHHAGIASNGSDNGDTPSKTLGWGVNVYTCVYNRDWLAVLGDNTSTVFLAHNVARLEHAVDRLTLIIGNGLK